MRKTQKVEGFHFFLTAALPIGCCEATKFDETRFLWMQTQVVDLHLLPECAQKAHSIVLALEAHDKIIRVTNDDNLADAVLFPPFLYPAVQNVGPAVVDRHPMATVPH